MNDRQQQPLTQSESFASEPSAVRSSLLREQLLSKVLSETLNRRHEDPTLLVKWLRDWRIELNVMIFDAVSCEAMVSQVIRYRLGESAAELPIALLHEVAEVLWHNPDSRARMERLWMSLDQT